MRGWQVQERVLVGGAAKTTYFQLPAKHVMHPRAAATHYDIPCGTTMNPTDIPAMMSHCGTA